MSDEFKKFIETGGKTLDEIKKTIDKILSNTVDIVVDEAVKPVLQNIEKQIKNTADNSRRDPDGYYRSEKIPPRGSLPKRSERLQNLPPERERLRAAYPREPIPEHMNRQDEYMLDMIRDMRSLEVISDKHYITARCAEATFVKQGLFMADVSDDYNRRVFCALQTPAYMAMSNSQLRTYFTWRTDVRRGKYTEADKPYVLLYCYELMNKIGVSGAAEAFGKLLELWEECKPFAGYLNALMPRWLKDLYVYNDISSLYPDIEKYTGISDNFPRYIEEFENGDFGGKFDYLAEYSAYNIKGSIFLSDKTRPLIDGACAAALKALAGYFSERGADIAELLCGKVRKDYSWTPFAGAIVDLGRMDGFRPLKISAAERYCVKRGEPTLEVFDFSPSRGFIGYLLKSVEAELRRRVKFKRYITPNAAMLENDLRNREKLMSAVTDEKFDRVIISAVEEYCRQSGISAPEKPKKKIEEKNEYVREKVEIDVSKLESIREKSDELAKKLIVEEISEPPENNIKNIGAPDSANAGDSEHIGNTAAPDELEEIAASIYDDEFSEQIADYTALLPEEPEYIPAERNNIFGELPSEWQDFANDLTPTHLAVLKCIRNGSAVDYCRQHGIMPETVFEEINTAALDAFSDVVIEDGGIIPDYCAEIDTIIKAAGI